MINRGLVGDETPFTRKSCYDCGNIISALSLWCGCKEAREARGTILPGVILCTFWKPDLSYIDDKYKTDENGYIPKISRIKTIISNIKAKLTII